MDQNDERLIKNILSANWLRPETVVWRSMDAMMLKRHGFSEPTLDLGCGDGMFTFIALGGETDYDVYSGLQIPSGQVVDIYDSVRERVSAKISKKLTMKITGMDHKQNLLDHARNLDFYQELIRHDLNEDLPLEDESFTSIFSNVFYWIDNIENLLRESRRVLRNDGNLIVFVPDKKFKEYKLPAKFSNDLLWVKALDNSMHTNMIHCMSLADWKKLFEKNGFKIDFHESYMSDRFVKFHNIGTRTYSKYMIQAINQLAPEKRAEIKKQVISDMLPVIKSYLEYEEGSTGPKCFHMFVLKKQ